MPTAGTITVDFAAETSKFTAELKKVNEKLSTIETGFGSLAAVAKTALAGLAVTSVVSFSKAIFESADALGDMAARISVSASELSRLKYVANQSDVEFQSLAIGVKQFQKSLSEGKPALDELSLSASELKKLSLTQQFEALAEAFGHVENPADRTRLAMDLFGKSGTDLIPVLDRGAAGISQLGLEGERVGAVLSDKMYASVGAADEAIKRMKASSEGLATSFVARLAPAITSVSDALTHLIQGEAINPMQRRLDEINKGISRTQELIDDLTLRRSRAGIIRLSDEQVSGDVVAQGRQRLNVTDLRAQMNDLVKARDEVTSKLNEFQNAVGTSAVKNAAASLDPVSITSQRSQQTGAEKAAELDAQLQQFVQSIQIGGAIDQGMQGLTSSFVELEANAQLQMKSLWEQSLSDYSFAEILKTDIAQQEAERRAQLEQASQQKIASYRQQTLGLGIQGLSMLGRHSKAAAVAAIALNRGQAIAHIGMSIAEANAKSISMGPWGWALIAANVALGMAEIANVNKAASGSSTIGGTNASLPGLGGTVNPIFTQPAANQDDQSAASQKSVQIIVNGDITGESSMQWFVEQMKTLINDRDVVLINKGSAQANELVPT